MNHWANQLSSQIPGFVWPALTPARIAPLVALLNQFEQTERLPVAALQARQFRQLVTVAKHAARHSTFFRDRLATAGLTASELADPEGLQRLPVLTRRDIQGAGEQLFCARLPAGHGPTGTTSTSGSSGEPVVVQRTSINQLMWRAITIREHLWHQRDFTGRLAIIRANVEQGAPKNRRNWGPPVSEIFPSGTSHLLSINTDIAAQAQWLQQINPHYLLTYPTNLAALLDEMSENTLSLPALRQIRTIGETLTTAIRERVAQQLGIDVVDAYSSQEVGGIALQCPHSGLYHIMSESLRVEVLDEQGNACAPGETGRVVITDLLNFATPLIRYDIGDYAQAGPLGCPCGRTLPTLNHIVGRQRNMLRHPNGNRYWPLVGFDRYRDIAPIRQYQLIQKTLTRVEVRLVCDAPLTPVQEQQLGKVIVESLGYAFELNFNYFERALPRSAGGKFEEFVCEVR